MPLREKSIIVIGFALLLLLLSIFFTADAILAAGYSQLEKSDVERNVKRAVKAVENQIAALENFVKDWAQSDEAYQFMATGDRAYIERYIKDSLMMSRRLNVIVYTDPAGHIVYARAFDWNTRQEVPLDKETAARLAAVKPSDDLAAAAGSSKGILTLPAGQMIIAAREITGSQGNTSRGVLLVGRYLTYLEKEFIAERVQLALEFTGWNSELPADFLSAQPYLSQLSEVYVKTLDENYVAGYTVMPDIYGDPALFMRILTGRAIAQQGQQILNYFIAMLLVAGLVFGLVILVLLEWNVLSRLDKVGGVVKKITKSKDLSLRVPVCGGDELAELAVNINNMLESLETAQASLWYVGRHDTLTGLYNRTVFEEYLETANVSGDSLQIIVVDVDGLKLINDTLGHASGDELLRKAAATLQAACPPDAVIARFGGDEFAILLKNHSSGSVAALCRDIKAAVTRTNNETPGMVLSLSIGFAVGTEQANDATEILKEADNYMYRDKLLHNRSTRSAIVQTLKKALEARDFITDGHAQRLQELVQLLGTELGLSEPKLAELQLFAQFHDIGKVGIPDGILFKPGRLTAEEMAIMRSHSEIGYRIARAAPDLVFIADWVLKHHEWWNGAGYPLGLTGEDIPLECRLLGLADAYDAMTNQRPYRRAMTKAEAIAEIRKNAGSQFDPALVEVFIAILAKLP